MRRVAERFVENPEQSHAQKERGRAHHPVFAASPPEPESDQPETDRHHHLYPPLRDVIGQDIAHRPLAHHELIGGHAENAGDHHGEGAREEIAPDFDRFFEEGRQGGDREQTRFPCRNRTSHHGDNEGDVLDHRLCARDADSEQAANRLGQETMMSAKALTRRAFSLRREMMRIRFKNDIQRSNRAGRTCLAKADSKSLYCWATSFGASFCFVRYSARSFITSSNLSAGTIFPRMTG